MLKCIAVDDEPLALRQIAGYIGKIPYLELPARFNNALDAQQWLAAEKADLIFVDINMPDLNGVDFVRGLVDRPMVVFTTAYSEYAVEGFKLDAVDYLLKPISYNDFLAAANKALAWFELKRRADRTPEEAPRKAEPERQSLFVKTEYRLQRIDLDRIRYIEGLKDYVKIHVEGEPHPVVSLLSLKTLEEQLPSDPFIRVHRSYIVQPSKIRTIERNRILFGSERIPISENCRQSFYDFLARHSLFPGSLSDKE